MKPNSNIQLIFFCLLSFFVCLFVSLFFFSFFLFFLFFFFGAAFLFLFFMHLSAFSSLFFLFFNENRLKDLNVRLQGLKSKYKNYRNWEINVQPKIKNIYKNGMMYLFRFRFSKQISKPTPNKNSPSCLTQLEPWKGGRESDSAKRELPHARWWDSVRILKEGNRYRFLFCVAPK